MRATRKEILKIVLDNIRNNFDNCKLRHTALDYYSHYSYIIEYSKVCTEKSNVIVIDCDRRRKPIYVYFGICCKNGFISENDVIKYEFSRRNLRKIKRALRKSLKAQAKKESEEKDKKILDFLEK